MWVDKERLKLFYKAMQNLDRIIGQVVYYAMYIAGIITLLMAFVTTYGVFRRYALNSPEPYSYEIGIFCLISSVCLSLAYIQRQDRNLKVDLLSSRVSERWQGVLLNIVVPAIAMVYLFPLIWKSWQDGWHSLQIGERTYSAWGPAVGPIKMLVPFGAALLCMVLIAQLIRGFNALRKPSRKLYALKKESSTETEGPFS
jgi:TRAP-type C4-dicarboxylate transport system permease small subunit